MNRKITAQEIACALAHTPLPIILTAQEAAQLLRIKISTLYRHLSEGKYGSAVRRGKPLRFFRERLIQECMQ